MKRWVVVHWDSKTVLPEAFVNTRDAWREIVKDAKDKDRSTNDYDYAEVDIEAL
jgi:hypothetical protein